MRITPNLRDDPYVVTVKQYKGKGLSSGSPFCRNAALGRARAVEKKRFSSRAKCVRNLCVKTSQNARIYALLAEIAYFVRQKGCLTHKIRTPALELFF